MKFVTKNGQVIAIVEPEDSLTSSDEALQLLEGAFKENAVGFVLPAGRVMGALPLLKDDLRQQITLRFSDRSPRLAIAGRIPRIIENMVKGYAKKAGLSASLLIEEDIDSAVDALSAPR